MAKLILHQEKILQKEEFLKLCPFGAFELYDGIVAVSAACKMCGVCVKRAKNGELEYIEDNIAFDKNEWKGVAVYCEHENGEIHPVTYELIGKANELAAKTHREVYCLFAGSKITQKAEELLHYGVQKVFVYDHPALTHFSLEPYTAVFEDFINEIRPSSVLIGATAVGRQLAPRTAARFRTGLTADCTVLDIEENTDLIQIRPAFGGNIMAKIKTPNHRPQMATVRYKVMDAPPRSSEKSGEIIVKNVREHLLESNVRIKKVRRKERVSGIECAEILVACGRGIKNEEGFILAERLADVLNAEMACTRPLAESGRMAPERQIGLSGRTVRPKLIITLGISGAVQFTAGMNGAECIIAVNEDENAPIFNIAHYGLTGDVNKILEELLSHELQKL